MSKSVPKLSIFDSRDPVCSAPCRSAAGLEGQFTQISSDNDEHLTQISNGSDNHAESTQTSCADRASDRCAVWNAGAGPRAGLFAESR
eukprot:2337751-Rhodomonas_salina.4